MNEDLASSEGEGSQIEKAPRTLSGFLLSECPANIYLAALEKENKLLDDGQRADALNLAASDPKLLTKVVELARSSVSQKRDPRIRRAVLAWSAEVLRAQDADLASWGQLASANPDVDIRQLALRVRRARTEKDKATIANAEQVLLIGLAVASARPDFNVIGTLSAVFSALNQNSGISKTNLQQNVQKTLLRASPKLLENLAAMNQLAIVALDDLRIQFTTASNQLQDARDRSRGLLDNVAARDAQIEELRAENSRLSAQLSQATQQIAGVKGGAAHEMIEVRARMRQLLVRKLQPFLNEAHEALSIDPPVSDVAKQRLELVRSEIEKELEWLNQFLA